MNAVTRFHRPRWVIARVIDDKTVLYQADSGEVFYLEGTAVAMWRWIAERDDFTMDDLAQAMSAAFAGDPDQMRAEIKTFIDDLVEQSLLHIGEAAACR
ncbi:MAG: hypothetical protein AUJ55_02990 [Proteobacteria bacterium CG1_02_64_396]|nr:MAG: hypothetical protein AUJ55_02990 [Proteobacteria bacterium CG1_02_64_396]